MIIWLPAWQAGAQAPAGEVRHGDEGASAVEAAGTGGQDARWVLAASDLAFVRP
jgi:hypothetical protein